MKQQDVCQTSLLKQLMIKDKMREFFVWGKPSGREQESGETERERECVREIERAVEKDSVGGRSGHSHK